MSNTKLIGALAVTGGVLALGGTAVAFGSDGDNANAGRPEAVYQASSQHETGPAQDESRDDDGERGDRDHDRWEDYRGDHYRGDHDRGEDYRGHHRGNPWPEFCSTKDSAISGDRAQQIALDKVPGASVVEVDLDRCYGMEWGVELRKGNVEYDIDINADNGQITEFEQDEDDDDDD